MSLPAPETAIRRQLPRFLATGAANTAVGGAVIVGLMAAGLADVAANAAGFAVGAGLSFFLNRRWTFGRTSPGTTGEAARFALVLAVAWVCNLAVLLAGGRLGAGGTVGLQALAVASYAAVAFVGMRRFAFAPVSPSPGLWLAAGVGLATLLLVPLPIGHDVVWQFWIARQMNHGVPLYDGINEINPPLWFWMAMPLDRLATLLGVAGPGLVKPALAALAGLSFALVARLLPDLGSRGRGGFVGIGFVLGLVVALPDFAQREHIAMLAALPYVLLAARRAEGAAVPVDLALAVGLAAAPGLALKHYFVAVPLLLELWLVARLGRGWRPVRPETLVLAAGAVVYAAAILWFAPAFLHAQVPMVTTAYGGYEKPLIALLTRQALLWIVALAAIAMVRPRDALTTGLLIAAAGFALAYAAQQKGWRYHGLPVTFFLALAGLAVAVRGREAQGRVVLAWAVVGAALLSPALGGLVYRNAFVPYVEDASAGVPPGAPVFVLTADPRKAWSGVVEGGFVWPSRFMALWMLPAILAGVGDPEALAALSHQVRRETAEDLACNPPVVILADRLPLNRLLAPLKPDLFRWLAEEPAAARELANYSLERETPVFAVWRRTTPVVAPPAGCRRVW